MDLGSVVGLGAGTFFVVLTMILSGSLAMYWDFLSVIIVVFGAISATCARFPLNVFLGIPKIAMKTIFTSVDDPKDLSSEIIELANTARKGSILALESVEVTNRFMAKGVRYMVDGYDPQLIEDILTLEISYTGQRHKDGKAMFDALAEAFPAFGMIGTVIGLIVIMSNLDDVSMIGPGLAVALITTLYGAILSNLIAFPMAAKLEYRSKEELRGMMIIKAGVAGILNGENPRTIAEKLEVFMAPESGGAEDA